MVFKVYVKKFLKLYIILNYFIFSQLKNSKSWSTIQVLLLSAVLKREISISVKRLKKGKGSRLVCLQVPSYISWN